MKENFHWKEAEKEKILGCLARSLAGRDKGEIFVILDGDGEYLYLADGRYRTAAKPKRKKKKHAQLIFVKQDEIFEKLREGRPVYDAEIKTFIRCFKRENQVIGSRHEDR